MRTGGPVLINDSDCFNHDGIVPPSAHHPMPSLRDLLVESGIGDDELQQLIDAGDIAADSFNILLDPDCLRALDGPVGASFLPMERKYTILRCLRTAPLGRDMYLLFPWTAPLGRDISTPLPWTAPLGRVSISSRVHVMVYARLDMIGLSR